MTILTFILAVANLLLIGCSDKPLFIELHSASSGSENITSWDFSDATDYIYDPNKIEFVDGKAQLKQVDQTHEEDDFLSGTHVGTYYDSDALKVRLLEKPPIDTSHINSILPDKAPNLIGYWRFDGNVSDEVSGGSFTLFNDSGLDSSVVKLGSQALEFPTRTSANFGSLTNGPTGASPRAIVFWIYPITDTTASSTQILDLSSGTGTGEDFAIKILDNTIGARFVGHAVAGESNRLFLNQWNLVAIVVPSGASTTGEIKFYINGYLTSLIDTGGASKPLNTLDFDLNFSDIPFQASVDELAIWNTDLTDLEIQAIYESQNFSFTELSSSWTPHYDKLVGYWKMEGNWQDSTNNGFSFSQTNDTPGFSAEARVGTQALDIDGNDQLSLSPDPLLDNLTEGNYSIASWVKINAEPAGTAYFIRRQGSEELRVFQGSGFRMVHTLSDSSIVSADQNSGYNLNQWYYVVGTVSTNLGEVKLYIDGELIDTATFPAGTNGFSFASVWRIGRGGCCDTLDSQVDDLSFWNTTLSQQDIMEIYNRQKQKFSGHYDSPVIDIGNSGTWSNIDVETSLPFGKEIVAQASESSSNYPSLVGDLSNDLVGYWSLNETTGNSVGGSDFEDKSANGNDGDEFGGVLFGEPGMFEGAAYFDGANDGIHVNLSTPLTLNQFTVSAWVKAEDLGSWRTILATDEMHCGIVGDVHGVSSQRRSIFCRGSGVLYFNSAVPKVEKAGEWYHVAISWDGTTMHRYTNGTNKFSSAAAFSVSHSAIRLGSDGISSIGGPDRHHGWMDEVSLWSRSLSDSEIQQLYRRGANRIKYQVKSCVDSTCECKAFNSAPVGSADDCDGDGTPNSLDFDDIYKAEFVGPGGNGVTAFSELFNRDAGSMTFTCNTNTTDSDNDICVDDEITLTGDSSALPPSFSFADFPSPSRPIDNRYFQYRVLMEAEENTACSGEPCLPELTSVEIGPTGRFYAGSPSVVNKTSESLDKALDNLQVSNSNGCNMSYQISNDRNNFYYWDGTSWVTGSQVSESNDLTTLNSNIGTFTEQVGLGDFYFRSYLGNSNFGECDLDEIQVNKSRP